MSDAPVVRRIRPDEGLRLRALRLRALADAPWAFGSTLAREEAFAEAVWQERAARGAAGEHGVTYVAEEGGRWIGMATGIVHDLDGSVSISLRCSSSRRARGQGVGAALVEAVAAWARERGMRRVHLGVTTTNRAALKLYQRCGFKLSGREHSTRAHALSDDAGDGPAI